MASKAKTKTTKRPSRARAKAKKSSKPKDERDLTLRILADSDDVVSFSATLLINGECTSSIAFKAPLKNLDAAYAVGADAAHKKFAELLRARDEARAAEAVGGTVQVMGLDDLIKLLERMRAKANESDAPASPNNG
jgi:hypothetical protein